MPDNRSKSTILVALAATPLMLIACSRTPELTVNTSVPAYTPHARVTLAKAGSEQERVFADLLSWLTEPRTVASLPDNPDAPGPQLAAGDWLAFECAFAGGYWDAPTTFRGPIFASVSDEQTSGE